MPDSSPPRPNFLLIMTDQQRGDCLGCDGNSAIETPYLDELAGAGTRFRCAYSAVPSCLPARASLLTGMDQWHTGILGMGKGQGPIPSNYVHTLPGELAKAGYHTQAIGKNHFTPHRALNGYHNCILDESGRAESPSFISDYRLWFDRHKAGPYEYRDHSVGWNSWMSRPSHLPEHLHPTWWTAQQSIEWLRRRDPEKPFFLKCSFARPHSPYDPPQAYFDLYRDRPVPPPCLGDWCAMHDDPATATRTDAWRGRIPDHLIERARRAYYASVTFIDHQIGRLLYEMQKDHGEALANTYIIFLSDHGDMLGDHHLWRKTYAYEGSARVPMIIRPPANWGCPRGQVRDEVVELRDVMPTLLAAAGVAVPETCQGLDMDPLVRGVRSPSWRPFLHGEHIWCYSHEQAMHYLTDGREKYVYLPYLGIEQFFDLQADPGELRNLASNEARTRPWRQRLVDTFRQRGSTDLLDGDRLRRLTLNDTPVSPHYRRFNCLKEIA